MYLVKRIWVFVSSYNNCLYAAMFIIVQYSTYVPIQEALFLSLPASISEQDNHVYIPHIFNIHIHVYIYILNNSVRALPSNAHYNINDSSFTIMYNTRGIKAL